MADELACGWDFGNDLCDVLGLQKGQEIRRIELDVTWDNVAEVRITRLVTQEQGAKIVEALQRYNLKPKGAEETVSDLGQGVVDVTSMADDHRMVAIVKGSP